MREVTCRGPAVGSQEQRYLLAVPLLLRDGLVIDTEPELVVRPHTDVLVDGDTIAAVGRDLSADGADVLDARGRIVLPGFVDTHRHVWEAALRSVAADVDLGTYLGLVLRGLGPRYTPEQMRVSTRAGALECLDSGITTVQDYAHLQLTPAHTDAGIAGLRDAGIRVLFGYGAPVFAAPMPDDAWSAELRRVRDAMGGLLTMALAATGPTYGTPDGVVRDWRLAAELDIPVVVHIGASTDVPRPIELLRGMGLLRPSTLYVHGNSLVDDDVALIGDSGAAVSIAPAIEALMGHGAPMVNRLRAAGIRTGLGVDVVTSTPGDMFSLMRAALMSSHLSPGPRSAPADVLRMATMDGAAALGMGDVIGSLRPGKQADVVLLDATAPNLAGGTAHDPVAAVVTAAHPGNVETVLVAGRIVKRDGRLVTGVGPEIGDIAGFLAATR